MEIDATAVIFDLGLLLAVAVAYYTYTAWRDERLDAEDEKHDRIHGEKQT
jgi:hypothetical protein